MLTLLAFAIPAFLLGLLLGSFLNVCISRLPEHQSIAKPRSRCPECLARIRWYDNVPLLSWALLAARCRHCKATIPWRYPAVELATGLWFALAVLLDLHAANVAGGAPMATGQTIAIVVGGLQLATAGFLLIGLAVMDWRTQTLPDAFTLTGMVLGFCFVCVQATFLPRGVYDIHLSPKAQLRMSSPGSFASQGDVFMTGPEHLVLGRVLAICAAAAIPWAVGAIYKAVRHRDGLGAGDIKLMAMLAAFLGFASAMLALFVGVILAAVYAVVLLARGRATATTRVPLGTFLCVGGLLAALAGEPMVAWYRGLF